MGFKMIKSKISRKKEEKRDKLPIYDIDSSIILEVIFNNPRENDSRMLFQLSGYRNKYRLMVSSIVMGEVIYIISKEKDIKFKENCIEALKRIMLYHDVEVYRPSKTTIDKVDEVLATDTFFKSMDALVFASALENKSKKFVTFDSDFLESKNLREKFKEVKIDDKA